MPKTHKDITVPKQSLTAAVNRKNLANTYVLSNRVITVGSKHTLERVPQTYLKNLGVRASHT